MTNASKTSASIAHEIERSRGMSPMMAAMTGMVDVAVAVAESDALWAELDTCMHGVPSPCGICDATETENQS